MNNLYEALEICLQDIEQGRDLETVLVRYPDLADELRPILEASVSARSMAVLAPSPETVRRNRTQVLRHAVQMREARARSSQRFWLASLRRLAVTFAVFVVLFVTGTGLVGASSETLPGDSLYPVKRTWEGVRLFFAFNARTRQALELEHENERLHELRELFAEGRSEEVDFRGQVTSQAGDEWIVAGVRVLITDETDIRDAGIVAGSPVRVRGVTQGNNTVIAERIRLLDSDEKLPEFDDDDGSGSVTGDQKPRFENTETAEPDNTNSDDDADDNDNGDDDNDNNDDDNDNGSNDDDNDDDDDGNENGEDDDNSGRNENDDNGGNSDDRDDNDRDDLGGGDDDNSGSNDNDDD